MQIKPKDFFRNQVHPYFKQIETVSIVILKLPAKPGRAFNPFEYVNQKFNQKIPAHPGAVAQTLRFLEHYWDQIDKPWAYANSILKTINGNYCERDHIDNHENVKAEFEIFVKESELTHLIRDVGW